MHILFLNDSPPGTSSVSNVIKGLTQGLEEKGHRTTLITSHRKEVSSDILRKNNVISLPVSYRPSLRHYKCLHNRGVSRMIEDEIGKLKPGAISAHNVHFYLTYESLKIARKFTPNVFITMHDVFSFAFGRLNTARFLDSGGKDTRLTVLDHWKAARFEYNPLRNMAARKLINSNAKAVI